MDGFATDPRRSVFVLAATNFEIDTGQRGIGAIDGALARRFDRSIRVDLPDKAVRREYLQVRLARHHGSTVTPAAVERLAGRAVGMSQADLERVIELAARLAAKAGGPLTDALLEEALELTRHGEEKAWGAGFLERVARHEAGHALLYWQAGQTPAYLTIVARGSHGGYMEHDDEDVAAPLHTRRQMLDRLRTALGGRAAELLYYGSDEGLSTGAAGDLESATRLAKAMICRYGMDETIGPVALTDAEIGQGPLAAAIAERVRALIAEELAAAQERLHSAQPALDRLVDALLDQGRLTGEEIERVLQEN
jgi:ATP-dependent Zn protease